MKKLLSTLLATCMLAAAPMQIVLADDAEYGVEAYVASGTVTLTQGKMYNAAPCITAKMTNDTSGATEYSYQWLTSSNGTDWVELPTEKTDTYIISARDKNQYLNCRVTPVADGAEGVMASSGIKITSLGTYARLQDPAKALFKGKTPAKYKFTVGDREYVLLDYFNDKKSAYYVMTEAKVGKTDIPYDTTGNGEFSTERETNIGYKLNNELSQNKINGEEFDPNVISHINKNYVWHTEAGRSDGVKTEYDFTAGIGLISMTEAYKYIERFGAGPDGQQYFWWTRTQRVGSDIKDNILAVKYTGDVTIWDVAANATNPQKPMVARPTFYLDENFFKEVKCKVFNDETGEVILGSEVCKAIAAKCSATELLAMYELEEVIQILSAAENCPTLENVSIAGTATEGSTVVANYSFVPYKNGAESDSNIMWLSSSSEDGQYTLCGTTGNKLEITSGLNGKYIKYIVIPNDTNGRSGKAYESEAVKVITNTAKFDIKDINITGNAVKPTVKNTSDKSASVRLIMAVYDSNNMLVSTNEEKFTLAAGQTASDKSVDFPALSSGQSAMAMLWINDNQPLFTIFR